MRYFLIFLGVLANCAAGHCHAAEHLHYPDRFDIRQDRTKRLFYIQKDKQFLGTAVSSAYGVLDFYGPEREKQWTNIDDVLFSSSGQVAALIQFSYYVLDFGRRPLGIFSNQGELLQKK